ncbi:delta(14)-sterol reductase TM7SF2-like isoform X1 [Patiria miniata]|uniref:Delta(14)-sterol reductase n=2 Tax=Patiria miniata TaxID=46514 RepID=A0A913Z5A4_PATMI|nr:delta(14)-sterol reductase TM7SF2-like isoform X1 [Patiria miniata]
MQTNGTSLPHSLDKPGGPSAAKDGTMAQDNGKVPQTAHYEFGGPVGALFIMISLPVFIYYLYFACDKNSCAVTLLPLLPGSWDEIFDLQVFMIFLGWVAFQAVLYMLPIGKKVKGLPLRTGRRLQYRMNGLLAFVISVALFAALVYYQYPVTILYDKFLPFLTSSVIFSAALSVFVYIKSLAAPNHALAAGGNSGNIIYDFFIGHELNPRLGNFDIKIFCELRPGLIGWVLIDLAFVVKSWTDFPDNPPWCLLAVTFSQVLYVADSLWFEECILSTMDIIHDGFGFMLSFGDLAWVPFTYTLQARYLVDHPEKTMPSYCLMAVVALGFLGYYIFRASNSQKNAFRQNPHGDGVKHLQSIPTATGKRLLVSGWWGLVRHPNYLGDLILALSWSLYCGFDSIIPYFYPIYFTVLLVHRCLRDAAMCKEKYGEAWDRYCQKVPYRIFPYIF